MRTVHLVFNAHIDPIWLWPWQSGVDTLLATCRSACDRLERHEDLHFTRGEAWVYREVERLDPELFARIRTFVEAGRWHIVGGWWIQPDCNGPSGFAFERQIGLGREYFEGTFGRFPRIAYNVDSFGHAATLPGYMRQFGQDRYVFMRPQEHELKLPARLFRWRGYDGGPEVVAFRIAKAYTTRAITREHVEASLTELPAGLEHTMCFVGVGDHGGGPTESQIAWCRQNRDAFARARLVFSSPEQFFEAIEPHIAKLPVVTGELQHHSVGCYSVHRAVKVGIRRAEHRLVEAELISAKDPRPEPGTQERLKDAWRGVCFNHFHDTFGGSCIPSAYEQVHAQIGSSYAAADEIVQHALRRQMVALPPDALQRIVLFNASDAPYDGYAVHEPWLEAEQWMPHWRLIDEQGRPVAHQRLAAEALVPDDYLYFLRLLLRVRLGPGELRTLRIDPTRTADGDLPAYERAARSLVKATTVSLENDCGVRLCISGDRGMRFPGVARVMDMPRLQLVNDPTDTWTHEADRYDGEAVALPEWDEVQVGDTGPLMASLQQRGRLHDSRLMAEWRVYAGEPFIELLLRVYWSERHKLLKLVVPVAGGIERRWDGIPGGDIERQSDGRERPVRDRTLLQTGDGAKAGVVFPDAYALDVAADGSAVRITLLRSPLMAHHFPFPADGMRGVYADQGLHDFRFRFFVGTNVTGELLDGHALMLHRPPLTGDWTRGMKIDRDQ